MAKKPKAVPEKPTDAEQYVENARDSQDTITAISLAFDMEMSTPEALAFVQKNRHLFEAAGGAIVEDQSIADTARTIKAFASASASKAAKKPRPRGQPTCKSIVIEAMTTARKNGMTLHGFLDAAAVRSIDRLTITPSNHAGVLRYTIDADDIPNVDDEKRVAYSTIEEYWTAAGRSLTTG